MNWPSLSEPQRLALLAPPPADRRPLPMVLDTDTYNEIDDQFALAYALLSPRRLRVEAIYAAPFHNRRSNGPADGMQRSYDEIIRVLDRFDRSPDDFAYRGATEWLADPTTPSTSEAAKDLVQRAMAHRDGPLYVVAIGAITNVASALLVEPRLVERIVVVWLAGHALHWPTAAEFNLKQDLHASRIIFDSGVPLVHVPCRGVAEHVRTTLAELRACIGGSSRIATYLTDIFAGFAANHFAWAKELWDVAAIAWLINPDWLPSHLAPSPILSSELTWSHDPRRQLIRELQHCHRNAVFTDLFNKLRDADVEG